MHDLIMIKLQLATAIILLVLLVGLLFNVLMYPFFTEFIDYRLQYLYPSISSTSLKIFRVSIYDYGTFAVVAAMVIALLFPSQGIQTLADRKVILLLGIFLLSLLFSGVFYELLESILKAVFGHRVPYHSSPSPVLYDLEFNVVDIADVPRFKKGSHWVANVQNGIWINLVLFCIALFFWRVKN